MSDPVVAILGPEPAQALATGLLFLNAPVSLAIGGVALARAPVRRMLGPAMAYRLWWAPPLVAAAAVLAFFLPADSDIGSAAAHARLPHLGLLVAVWAVGALATATLFAVAQLKFLAEVKAGRGGPAVVGLVAPRVILPADDGSYTPEERELIRAHERVHVARKDPRAAAVAALFQCLSWFNPFAHLAAYLLRLDQELACDAAVVMARPASRGLYARTLLKTQLAATPLPFGCYWPARGAHPLEVRVALLKRRPELPGAASRGPAILNPVDAIRP